MSDMSNFETRLAELEAAGESTVPISDVRTLMVAIKDMFEGRFDGDDLVLYGELGELAKYINTARKELREFQPHDVTGKDIPDASDQLDAIVQQTESATGKIMDACENIEGIHNRVRDRLISQDPPLDPDVLAGVDDALSEAAMHVTNVYEACNFQDITGQRIMKIVKTLREVERQILRMVVVFGLKKDDLADEVKEELQTEADLLNGPQLPGNSLDQEDIDDILSKLL